MRICFTIGCPRFLPSAKALPNCNSQAIFSVVRARDASGDFLYHPDRILTLTQDSEPTLKHPNELSQSIVCAVRLRSTFQQQQAECPDASQSPVLQYK